jgi:hypothetical protein
MKKKPDWETKRIFKAYMNLIQTIVRIAAELPKEEMYRLKKKLRDPVHKIFNGGINPRKKYSESTIRNFYTENMKYCAELKAGVKIAFFNDYISMGTRSHITRMINDVEKITGKILESHYARNDEPVSVN